MSGTAMFQYRTTATVVRSEREDVRTESMSFLCPESDFARARAAVKKRVSGATAVTSHNAMFKRYLR